jgi:hypothetical protein
MSGDDRRTALLGRIEKIPELIASFFSAFTQDEVHHACLRQQPYRISQYPPAAGAFCGPSRGAPHRVHGRAFSDLEKGFFDCATRSAIALQLAERAIEGREPKADQAMFAVFHVADMLKKLKADHEAAFYCEKQAGAS